SSSESYTLTVAPVAESPGLTAACASSWSADVCPVTLGASVATHDSDDGAISVTITGLAGDLSNFNGGTYTAGTGTWTGSAAEFRSEERRVGKEGGQQRTITDSRKGPEAGSQRERYNLN